MELDINSLLDILVILLVFLLKSYSASELEVKLPKNLSLANSKSQDYGEQAPTVKVTSKGEIFLGAEQIATNIKDSLDSEGKVAILYNKLSKLRDKKLKKLKSLQGRKPASEKDNDLTVNLVFDKDLEYNSMKVVMHTTGVAGFNKFKFLVQAVE